MLPVNSINLSQPNNNRQNFGFKVLVKENAKLVDMADSYVFRELSKDSIELFKTKASTILPEKTVVVEPEIRNPKPFESFNADFFTDGKLVENIVGYDAHALLTYLKRAANRYTKVHSKFFYDGKQSPEMLARTARFKETNTRPLLRFKKNSGK